MARLLLRTGGAGLQQLPLSSVLSWKAPKAPETRPFIKHSQSACWSETATPCVSASAKSLLELFIIDRKVDLELTPRDTGQAFSWPPLFPRTPPPPALAMVHRYPRSSSACAPRPAYISVSASAWEEELLQNGMWLLTCTFSWGSWVLFSYLWALLSNLWPLLKVELKFKTLCNFKKYAVWLWKTERVGHWLHYKDKEHTRCGQWASRHRERMSSAPTQSQLSFLQPKASSSSRLCQTSKVIALQNYTGRRFSPSCLSPSNQRGHAKRPFLSPMLYATTSRLALFRWRC